MPSSQEKYFSQRDVPVFLRWVRIPLIFQHLQSCNQLGAGVARLNNLVDIAAAGSDVGIGKLLDIFRDQLLAPLIGVWGSIYLGTVASQ